LFIKGFKNLCVRIFNKMFLIIIVISYEYNHNLDGNKQINKINKSKQLEYFIFTDVTNYLAVYFSFTFHLLK